jgi:hypothetical protein
MDATRFFPNPAARSASVDDQMMASGEQVQRVWRSVAQQLFERCLRNINHQSLGAISVGALGPRVYLRCRMAQLMDRESAEAKQLLREGLSEVQLALKSYEPSEKENPLTKPTCRHSRRPTVSLLERSYVGCKALSAVLHFELQDVTQARKDARDLIHALDHACLALPPDECDVLYGRAGALQTIFFLREGLHDDHLGSDVALSLSRSILHQGEYLGASNKNRGLSLLWIFHVTHYLGAAHGVVGILQMILSLHPDELKELEKEGLLTKLRNTINELDAYCLPSGNLDSSIHAESKRSDQLVQWCHGAPGHVLLLVKASQVFQDEVYLEKAKRIALDVIWPRGLLRKGVGLCHGIAGNAYALLAIGRIDMSFRGMAQFFANFALSHLDELEGKPDRPYSLFEGLGGLCTLAIDLINPDQARFPLYEF